MENGWKDQETIKYWLQGIGESTKEHYLDDFPKFLKLTGMQPDQIIESRMNDLSSSDPKTRFKWEQKVLEYKTYSKYGFSFEYPKGMSISEQGLLESAAVDSSGMVVGILEDGEIEWVGVGWLTMVTEPDLEGGLEGALEGIKTEDVTSVDVGQSVTSEKAGDTMIYQYFNITVKGDTFFGIVTTHKTFYGIWSVWYNDTTDRFYQLGFMYSEQSVLPKFQQYLDSFVG